MKTKSKKTATGTTDNEGLASGSTMTATLEAPETNENPEIPGGAALPSVLNEVINPLKTELEAKLDKILSNQEKIQDLGSKKIHFAEEEVEALKRKTKLAKEKVRSLRQVYSVEMGVPLPPPAQRRGRRGTSKYHFDKLDDEGKSFFVSNVKKPTIIAACRTAGERLNKKFMAHPGTKIIKDPETGVETKQEGYNVWLARANTSN